MLAEARQAPEAESVRGEAFHAVAVLLTATNYFTHQNFINFIFSNS